MKQDKQHIDQQFEILNEYASPTSDDLWDKLDAARDKKDRRKGILWWKWGMGAFLLALLIPAGIYWSYYTNASEAKLMETDKIDKPSQLSTIPENSTETKSATAALNVEGEPIKDNIYKEKDTNKKTSLTRSIEKSVLHKSSTLATSTISGLSKNDLNQENKINTSEVDIFSAKTSIHALPGQSVNLQSKDAITTPVTGVSDIEIKETIDNKKQKLQGAVPNTDQSKEKTEVPKKLPIASVADLPTALPEINTELEMLKGRGPRGCYSFAGGRIKYDYYLDAFISPEYVLRTLEAKDLEHEDYRKSREASERTLYGVSSGVRLSFVTRRGLALRTGLVYNRTIEKMEIDEDDSVREVIVIDNGTDTTRTIQSGRRIKITYNRYHSLDIPLLLGYEVDARNFVFNMNAGIYFNIAAKQKGEILSETNEPMFINSNNPQRIQAFSKDLGMSVYGSFGFGCKMKNGFQLLIEPNLRYQLKPITLEVYPLKQQYIHMGLLVGLRKQF